MLEVGDKVKLIHYGITTGGCVERGDKGREGVIWLMTDKYISIQFQNYKESVLIADILIKNSKYKRNKEWGIYKREGNNWAEVTEKDISYRLGAEYKKGVVK